MRRSYQNTPVKQRILFTWSKCGQCQELKKKISAYISNGAVQEYDLDTIPSGSSLMKVFRQISPSGSVPALVVLSDGRIEGSATGMSSILRLF